MSFDAPRTLDAGSPFTLWAPAPHDNASPCGHGVLVEPRFDTRADELAREVALRLRSADHAGENKARVGDEQGVVVVSLATGRCEAHDTDAARFLARASWFGDAIAGSLDVLRSRADRVLAQRDRSTCATALAARTDDSMIPYDDLFPADWNPVVMVDGVPYHVVDHHCPSPACPCTDIVLGLYRLDGDIAVHVGGLRLDRRDAHPRPKATTHAADSLFEIVWQQYGDEFVRRHDEVRAAVRSLALASTATPRRLAATSVERPSRNAACPCGSGKKYKRCCAIAAPAGARPR